MPDGAFSLYSRDPETGMVDQKAILRGLGALRMASALSTWTGYEIHRLDVYAVIDDHSDEVLSAEVFLEKHAALAVIAAWSAGTPAASSARKQRLHEWWPALATALDALEANNA